MAGSQSAHIHANTSQIATGLLLRTGARESRRCRCGGRCSGVEPSKKCLGLLNAVLRPCAVIALSPG